MTRLGEIQVNEVFNCNTNGYSRSDHKNRIRTE
jgi:hypothetical protein